MASDDRTLVEERLSVFDEEADINDWVEVFAGGAMMVLGLFHMFNPGDIVDAEVMQWFAAAVFSAGIIWAGHGMKDMVVKDIRRSIAMMEEAATGGVDHALIRDVLRDPSSYKEFLFKEYEAAWEDGVISEEELAELKQIQSVIGLSDEEAQAISEAAKENKSK